ncbi:YoaK family protein [Novosphingobium sp. FKTRR1]|uniref:YoaK family protein n=1 Tax=unclassified Novosphingobium TaxID=2644732 RepID=UPI001CF09FC4|nr:YoaK family protein [Novosphingobium sp. FKTRR1]
MIEYDFARRRLAIALAALAGFVDAVGFLSADGYFVSFMSGNTTRLGVALGTSPARTWIPLVLISGFVGGVAAGSVLAHKAGHHRKAAVIGLVAVLLLLGAIARAAGAELAMLGALVVAMGALNNTFQRGGEVAIGLTYMTGALVKIGQGLAARLVGAPGPAWSAWALLWIGLLTGAVCGAFLQHQLPFGCLWIAAVYALGMVVLAFRLPAES